MCIRDRAYTSRVEQYYTEKNPCRKRYIALNEDFLTACDSDVDVYKRQLLICTATAFMCLSTSVVPTEEIAGAVYVQNAIASTLGTAGPVFLAVAMMLFAFTTLLGNYSYCEGCLEFIDVYKRQL